MVTEGGVAGEEAVADEVILVIAQGALCHVLDPDPLGEACPIRDPGQEVPRPDLGVEGPKDAILLHGEGAGAQAMTLIAIEAGVGHAVRLEDETYSLK